jgi:hypothetical protein
MSFTFHQRKPTALEYLSRSLGQGIGGGFQNMLNQTLGLQKKSLADQLQESQQTRERERKAGELKEFLNSEAASDLNPMERLILEGVGRELIPSAKELLDERLDF